MKRLWKYVGLGVAGRLVLMAGHESGIGVWLTIPIFALAAWCAYRDIKWYLAERKEKQEVDQ